MATTDKPSSLGHLPGEKWAFDDSVTTVFDDMLERSIPQYPVMRQLTTELAIGYVQPKTDIVDLGSSRGEALAPLITKFGAYNRFVAVEVSPPMLDTLRSRFKGLIDAGVVEVRSDDLRADFPPVRASVMLSVLTLMFTPINYRLRIIQDIYDHLLPGGAFLLVEKVLADSARLDTYFQQRYHQMKREAGYSWDEIERKRLALEGVQVPVTAHWNEELLKNAGFRQVDCYWRWLNFAGWIAVK